MPFPVGDRLKHPKKPDWGLGEVTASEGGYVTVYFVDAGEKKLSLKYVDLQLVTGEHAASSILDQVRLDRSSVKLVKYRIGREPGHTAAHNIRTWSIIKHHLLTDGSASYKQLVRWAKDHDHEDGGKGFINYCIGNGWLIEDRPESFVHSTAADQPVAEKEAFGQIPDQDERLGAAGRSAAIANLVLNDYIHGFFGYGSLSAPLWFIGMEEGTGQETLDQRLQAWKDLGSEATLDIRLFHERIGETRWFSMAPAIQRTWRRLIIVTLHYRGVSADKERIRSYQAAELARQSEALLEVMPLPHKSLRQWDHQGLFPSRSDYLSALAPQRLAVLQKAISTHTPKAVVMYGTTPPYPDYWRALAGGPLTSTEQGWSFRRSSETLYVVCQHPVAHGITDQYYECIGDFLRVENGATSN